MGNREIKLQAVKIIRPKKGLCKKGVEVGGREGGSSAKASRINVYVWLIHADVRQKPTQKL